MNTAVMSQGTTPFDSSSGTNQAWPFGRKVLFTLLLLGTLWGGIATSQLTTAMNEAEGLREANVQLSRLAADAKAVPGLKAEISRIKSTLSSEIAEKRRLAVMYERAEAGRKQAVADHGAALNRIAALEKVASSKAGAGKKPVPKRK